MSDRVKWIDITKGVAIILVIVGHTIDDPLIRGTIFSFHMPLFFILSGVTTTYSEDFAQWRVRTKRTFKKLVIPAIILTIITFWGLLIEDALNYGTIAEFFTLKSLTVNLKDMFISIIWASGKEFSIAGYTIPMMGIPWFLVCLFISGVMFDLLQLKLKGKKLGAAVLLITIFGVLISKLIWLPGSFDLSCAVIVFIYIGALCKKITHMTNEVRVDKTDVKLVIATIGLGGGIWAITLLLEWLITGSYLSLAGRTYPLFLVCFLTAVAGTAVICCCLIIVPKKNFIIRQLEYIGRNSMILLCIHTLDILWKPLLLRVFASQYLVCIIRVIIDLTILYLFRWFISKVKSVDAKSKMMIQ